MCWSSSERSHAAVEAVEVTFDGDNLTITSKKEPGRWFRGDSSVMVEVHAPIDSRARINVASASVNCRGRFSHAAVNSASSDIKIEEVTGDTNINAASGKAQIASIGGELTASTASGGITIANIEGSARVNSASGNTVIAHAGGDIDFGSASGNFQLGSAHRGTISVKTASVRASIGVDAGIGVWLDLNSKSGSINSDLDTTGDPPESYDLTVQVRTASGDIDIRRSKQKAAV